jgi:hypothetical protein
MIFIIIICLFNTSSLVMANSFQIKVLNPGILPDSPDYELKLIRENENIEKLTDPIEKAKYHLELADLRLVEALFIEERGKPQFVEELVKKYNENLTQALQYLAEGQAIGREEVDETLAIVRKSTKIHTDELIALIDRVPENNKQEIELAINYSRMGSNISAFELKQIAGGKLSVGKPEKVQPGPPEEPPGLLKKDAENKDTGSQEEPPGLSKKDEKDKEVGPPEIPPGLSDQDKKTGPPEEPPGLSKKDTENKKKEDKEPGLPEAISDTQ